MEEIFDISICRPQTAWSITSDGFFAIKIKEQLIKEEIPQESVDKMFNNAVNILSNCPNPDIDEPNSKTGVIIGKVQSGKTSNFITSLFDSQTDAKNIGQTNDRTLTLRAINVTAEEREILSSIFTSPKVFLYVGDFTKDEKSDYVLVDVKGDNVVRFEKDRPSKVDLTVTLPKHYTITRL